MGDPRRQLAELASRVDDAVAAGSMASERAVQLRAAEPLIDVLGWDVRGEEVHPEVTLGDGIVDYHLEIAADAAIAVVTDSPEGNLEQVVDETLRPVLEGALVPRGIATDGHRIVLLARVDGAVHDYAFPFADLAEHADALSRFHRSSLKEMITDEQAHRREAARRLDAERETVATELTEDILEVTGPEVGDVVSTEIDRLLDDLVDVLDPDGTEGTIGEGGSQSVTTKQTDRSDPSGNRDGTEFDSVVGRPSPESTDPAPSAPDSAPETPDSAAETTVSDAETPDSGPEADEDVTSASVDGGSGTERSVRTTSPDGIDAQESEDAAARDGDQSYVARFFGGSSSVGAVGTGSPRSTAVGVVRYLLENQQLHRAVTFPWEVESGVPVVADSRLDPAWIALENTNGTAVYVRPIDDPHTAKAAIEGLADAVGLRVMFQGDW